MQETLKILLLEQLSEDALLVENELKKGNISAQTLIVNNKPAFIKALTEFIPDIILSDHTLPDFNSIEALKIIKESSLNIPFILTTRAVSEEFAVMALQEGAEDYILKSNLSRLPSAIEKVVRKRKAQLAAHLEQEKKDEHTRLLFRIENSSLGYIEWTVPELAVKSISKRALAIFGLTKAELLDYANTGYIMVFQEDLALAREKAKELIDNVQQDNYAEHSNRKKDGSMLYCEWYNTALKDENGKVTAIMSLVKDITRRKNDETELKQREESYRRIVETSQEGIWTIDENNETNFVNDRMCRLLEYSKEEMMGKHFFECMDEKGRTMAAGILKSRKTEHIESFECCFITKLGKEICTIISANAIFGDDHKYLGTLAMVTDITERKASELETIQFVERLSKKNKDLQQFSYMVSHNLRAPIAKIQGLTLLFGNMQRDESFNKLLISNISREAANLDGVVKDMNSIITTRDSEDLQRDFFDFAENVNLIEQALQNEIVECNAVITVDFHEVKGIQTVKSYLYSIIYNLVSNSLKYKKPDIPLLVHLSAESSKGCTCFSVKDNGIGIDMEKYGERIFWLYKRFNDTGLPGKGIGLSMVKTQVESLGGKIEVESILGLGSTFKICLPQ